MEPFATADDLAVRWRALTEEDAGRANALLVDASVMIRRLAKGIDQRIAKDPSLGDAAKMVACQMVRRAMSIPQVDPVVTQMSQQIGPLMASATIGDRNLYLTKLDREMLGIRKRPGSFDAFSPN